MKFDVLDGTRVSLPVLVGCPPLTTVASESVSLEIESSFSFFLLMAKNIVGLIIDKNVI
ncbi:hypothetical protein [Pseudoalteromonas sp. MTN2-4]|uniref:hypothetical protein n=1 Tax=Pseudoalteromonas sp. MTN2-4 TaxID=3056555 RepID=UPI0036F345AA